MKYLRKCYIVTGATYPYRPTLWRTKELARQATVKLRKALRTKYEGTALAHGSTRGKCGVAVEWRYDRDMLMFMRFATLETEYNL